MSDWGTGSSRQVEGMWDGLRVCGTGGRHEGRSDEGCVRRSCRKDRVRVFRKDRWRACRKDRRNV